MRALFTAVVGVVLLAAGAAAAQQPAEEVGLPLAEGMEFDQTCGPRPQYQGRARCVRGPLAVISPAAEAYIAHFQGQGWQVVGGEENAVIFARRRADGRCDGLEMAAFYDQTRPVGPATQGWLGFAPIPGDVCAGSAAQ